MKAAPPLSWRPLSFFFSLISFLLCAFPAVPAGFAGAAREIQVVAAASSNFKKNPQWKRDIYERMAYANQVIGYPCGLKFTVKEYTGWEPKDETRPMDDLLDDLRSFIPGRPNELVVGFHKLSRPVMELEKGKNPNSHILGVARFFAGFIAIRDPFFEETPLQLKTTVVHEIGHVFGAVHVTDPLAIMNANLPERPQIRLDPDTFAILNLTRNFDLHRGMYSLPETSIDGLIPIYERMKRNSQEKDFYYFLGEFYKIKKRGDQAAAVWEEAIKKNFGNPEIEQALGDLVKEKGVLDASGRMLQQVSAGSQQKNSAGILNELAVSSFIQGKKEAAMAAWSQALESHASDFQIQANLAFAYLDTGLMDRAAKILEELRKQYPQNRAVLGNLGLAYMKNKEYQKAAQFFYAALQPKTDVPPFENKKENLLREIPESSLRFSLGTAFLKVGQGPRAAQQLKMAKASDPGNRSIDRLLSEAYVLSHNYVAAEKEIQAGLRQNNADPYLYLLLVQTYQETGRQARALETARHALKYGDKDLQAILYRKIGVIEAKKDPNVGLDFLRKSNQLNPIDPDTLVEMGKLYEKYNYKQDARRFYDEALRISPNHAEAKTRRRQVG